MYGRITPSPSPSPSPSPASSELDHELTDKSTDSDNPTKVHEKRHHPRVSQSSMQSRPSKESFRRHDRRSSSPFEVKLTPIVSKRISLDAFGAAEPLSQLVSTQSTDEASEELLEDNGMEVEERDEGDGDAEVMGVVGAPVFAHTSLSTIKETPSSKGSSTDVADQSKVAFQPTLGPCTPGSFGFRNGRSVRTEYYTPMSPASHDTPGTTAILSGDLSLANTSSDTSRIVSSPTDRRVKYRSAPLLPISLPLVLGDAAERTDANASPALQQRVEDLAKELRARDTVLTGLKEELKTLKLSANRRDEENDWDRVVQKDRDLLELRDLVQEKDEGQLSKSYLGSRQLTVYQNLKISSGRWSSRSNRTKGVSDPFPVISARKLK